MLALTPEQALSHKRLRYIDIRPAEEREAGLGAIPGSIGVPLDEDDETFQRSVERASLGRPVLLVCTSGERARRLAERLAPQFHVDLGYLAGGILRWGEQGLPLFARDPIGASGEQLSAPELSRRLAACFVGELAEVSLDRDLDPLDMLRSCFRRAEVDFEAPSTSELCRVIDHAAAISMDLGTPLDRIAGNLDMIRGLLPPAAADAPAASGDSEAAG